MDFLYLGMMDIALYVEKKSPFLLCVCNEVSYIGNDPEQLKAINSTMEN